MICGEGINISSKNCKKTYKDLHRLLTNSEYMIEYKKHPSKRCCHQQSFQKVYPLPGEDTDETARLHILTELKLKELLTRKKHNREDTCSTGTKLV